MLAGCVPPAPETPYANLQMREPTTGREYALYVPSYYNKDQAWPLIIALHGTHMWDNADWQVTAWKDVAEKHGLIVAAPQMRSVQGIMPVIKERWLSDLESDEQAILAVIDDVSAKYNIATIEETPPPPPKPARGTRPAKTTAPAASTQPVKRPAIMLTGFSAGGFPMWYTGLRNPTRFHMLVGMGANSSPEIMQRVPIVPELRLLRISIVFGVDDPKPVQDQSWQAYGWLHSGEVRCFQATRLEVKGGHHRRPELQYELWRKSLPKLTGKPKSPTNPATGKSGA
jgi:dienelactone hydrolase